MNKVLKVVMYFTPVIIICASVGVYFAISNKNENSNSPKGTENSIVHSQRLSSLDVKVFPDINQADFYKYLKIQDGLPYIPNEMIARIVNRVLEKMQFTDGDVQWGYKFLDESKKDELFISFKFTPNTLSLNIKPSERMYHIKIT